MINTRLNAVFSPLALLILVSVLQGGISGFTLSFFPLLMERSHLPTQEIGIANSAQMGAIIAVTLLLPFFLARTVLPRLYISASLIGALCMLALSSATDSLMLHILLRFAMGACVSILYVVVEYWLNDQVAPQHRGKVLGCYGMAIVVGMGAGPLLIGQTGAHGFAPFLLVAGMFLLAAALVFRIHGHAPTAHLNAAPPSGNPLRHLRLAPALAAAGLLHGVVESSMYAFLPIYGMRSGLTENEAASLLTCIFWGAIGMQLLLGWLADRWSATRTLCLAALINAGGALFLTGMLQSHTSMLWVYMLLWGGTIPTIYTLTSTCVGHRYQGDALAHAILTFILMYGLGSLLGPNIAGAVIAHMTPHGLSYIMALAYGLCALILLSSRQTRTREEQA